MVIPIFNTLLLATLLRDTNNLGCGVERAARLDLAHDLRQGCGSADLKVNSDQLRFRCNGGEHLANIESHYYERSASAIHPDPLMVNRAAA